MNRFVRRTKAIAAKEVLHILRDVQVLYLALGMPIVMLFVFGYAVSFDIDRIPLAVADADDTPSSRAFVSRVFAGDAFVRASAQVTEATAEQSLRTGEAQAVLIVPRGFAKHLARREQAEVQLIVDGSDSTLAGTAITYANGAVSSAGEGARIRTLFNPAMRSRFSIVPGVVALILATIAPLLAALTIAREWERGSMEQLFATPVRRLEVILGKLLPYVALGFLQALIVLVIGAAVFGIPVRGSLVLLLVGAGLFLVCMLAQALLISVETKNQLVAVEMTVSTSLLPVQLLSGFLFPIANMPGWLQAISRGIPARYFLVVLRGVLLKGTSASALAPQAAALAAFAALMLALAVYRFRRRLA